MRGELNMTLNTAVRASRYTSTRKPTSARSQPNSRLLIGGWSRRRRIRGSGGLSPPGALTDSVSSVSSCWRSSPWRSVMFPLYPLRRVRRRNGGGWARHLPPNIPAKSRSCNDICSHSTRVRNATVTNSVCSVRTVETPAHRCHTRQIAGRTGTSGACRYVGVLLQEAL